MGTAAPTTDATNVQPEEPSEPKLSAEEQRRLLDEAIERKEPLAQSELEIARMFLERGRKDIARRRLELILSECPRSQAAEEARRLLETLSG
jgi:Tfp pilus assembly protein FimV